MYTGIVQELATVISVTKTESGIALSVASKKSFQEGLLKGASVSVNGCCLTVTTFNGKEMLFDVIPQTLRVTNLGGLKKDDKVNLERSLKFGDEVGGHILSGHVSCSADAELIEENGEKELRLYCPKEWNKYIVEKGYVAINGASLTIAKVEGDFFSVFLIPETLEVTNLSLVRNRTRLNIEIDQAAITAHKLIESKNR